MSYSRRVVLLGLLAGVGGCWLIRPRSTTKDGLKRLLLELLPHLDLSPDTVPRFVDAYIALEGEGAYRGYRERRRRVRLIASDDSIAAFEEAVVSSFLLSTNYFQSEASKVEFVRLVDPYIGGCVNPFARFDDD